MSKYFYEITGDYKDNLKMKKEDVVIHDGNLIGLISYTNSRLELNLNYGKGTCYPCEIKKLDNLIIALPIEEYLYKSDYKYIPLIFEPNEYKELIEISYIDRELLDNIKQVSKQDIYNVLLIRFKLEFGIAEVQSFQDVIDNIIGCSEENDKVTTCIQNPLSNQIFNIKRVDKNNLINITLYIDFADMLYEWSPIIKVDEKYYFDLIDKYVLEIC